MIVINNKQIIASITCLFIQTFLTSLSTLILIENINDISIFPIITMGFIYSRILNEFLIQIKLFLNVGKVFNYYEEFSEWKYTQIVFLTNQLCLTVEIIFCFISCINLICNFSEFDSLLKNLTVVFSIITFGNTIIFVLFKPNTFYIIYYLYFIKKIKPIVQIKQITRNIKIPEEECSICLQKNDFEWCELPCKHKFHYECINPWINMSNTCPICRQ